MSEPEESAWSSSCSSEQCWSCPPGTPGYQQIFSIELLLPGSQGLQHTVLGVSEKKPKSLTGKEKDGCLHENSNRGELKISLQGLTSWALNSRSSDVKNLIVSLTALRDLSVLCWWAPAEDCQVCYHLRASWWIFQKFMQDRVNICNHLADSQKNQ